MVWLLPTACSSRLGGMRSATTAAPPSPVMPGLNPTSDDPVSWTCLGTSGYRV